MSPSIHNLRAQRLTALKTCKAFDKQMTEHREKGECAPEALCAAYGMSLTTLRLLDRDIAKRNEVSR